MRRSWPCDAREAVSATERAGRSRCARGLSERERDLTPCPPKTRPARSSSRRRGAPPGSAGRSPSSGPVQRLRSARTASGAATRPPPPRPWRRTKGVRKKAKPAAAPPTLWAQACLGWAHRVVGLHKKQHNPALLLQSNLVPPTRARAVQAYPTAPLQPAVTAPKPGTDERMAWRQSCL